MQVIEFPEAYSGKTYTLSVVTRSDIGHSHDFIATATVGGHSFHIGGKVNIIGTGEWQTSATTFDAPQGLTNFVVSLASMDSGSVDIRAAKLELGTVSTLANDPPMDFGAELLKCQRYFRPIGGDRRIRAALVSANGISFPIDTGIPMRIAPSLLITGANPLVRTGAVTWPQFSDFGFTVFQGASGNAYILAVKDNHGLADANMWVPSGVFLDANL